MAYLIAWVEGTPFNSRDCYNISMDLNEAVQLYEELKRRQEDSNESVYTVQLCEILSSTEPQHLDKDL